MTHLIRYGVSIEKGLSGRFDRLAEQRHYTNRSEAIRDLIRQELVKEEWKEGKEVAGALTMVYDHHRRDLVNRLLDIQHDYGEIIIATQHIHIDHHNCMEIIAVKGRPQKVLDLANRLKSAKGVKHCTLGMTGTGKSLS